MQGPIGCKRLVQFVGMSTARMLLVSKRPEPEESIVPQSGQRGPRPTATGVASVCGVFPQHGV